MSLPQGVDARGLTLRVVVLLAAWAALVGTYVAVGNAIESSQAVRSFDASVMRWVVDRRSQALVDVMRVVTWLGSWVAVTVLAAIVLVLRLSRRITTWFVVLAVLAWGGTQGGVSTVKEVVHRARPPSSVQLIPVHGWSFPSGHAATATVVAVVGASLVATLTPRRGPRVAASAGAVALVVGVGCSRVVLGVHWLSDVIAGVLLALLWCTAVVVIAPASARRSARSHPATRATGDAEHRREEDGVAQ